LSFLNAITRVDVYPCSTATRRIGEKIAQNVAQRISCQKFCITFVVEKSSPNLWDISEIIISLT
jgi:transposase-like protein